MEPTSSHVGPLWILALWFGVELAALSLIVVLVYEGIVRRWWIHRREVRAQQRKFKAERARAQRSLSGADYSRFTRRMKG